MDDKTLNNLTLSSWAASVWEKELRGVPLQLQESSLAWCMRQHADWRNFWNNLNNHATVETQRAANILTHIYNDAAVKLQLESNSPPEIKEFFQEMRKKGFSEMDALHAIAYVWQEMSWNSKSAGVTFDQKQYIERTKRYVENVIAHPDLLRGLRGN
jgi:Domain of unknown function (DUF1841)